MNPTILEVGELDILIAYLPQPIEAYSFTVSLVEILIGFKQKLAEGYRKDPAYKYIIEVFKDASSEDATKLLFI